MYHTLVLLLALSTQESNEAAQMFQQMEDKITRGKTLEARVEIVQGPGFKVTLFLAEGNKMRVEWGKDEAMGTAVSNGTELACKSEKIPKKSIAVPDSLNKRLRIGFARAGIFDCLVHIDELFMQGVKPAKTDVTEQVLASDFKLGTKEKVGDRDAQIIQYKLITSLQNEPVPCSVWLDVKTKLPLKRTLTVPIIDQQRTITELYTRLTLDEEIDLKVFALPK